jgi:hypothetical protein
MGPQSSQAAASSQGQYQKVLILHDERGNSSQKVRLILLFALINA